MSEDLRVAIVVVNYGSSALLARNIVRVTAGRPREHDVVIVDNPSSAEERRRVVDLAEQHRWHVESPATNLGFGGGMNVGARAALARGASVLVMLNPDAELTPDALDGLIREATATPFAAVAPRIVRPDGSVWFDGADLYLADGRVRSRRRRLPNRRSAPWLSGACVAMTADLWRSAGGFDERYFLYWEDIDLSWRIRAAGGSLHVSDTVTAVHDEGGTQRGPEVTAGHGRPKSSLYYYFNVRNRMLFAATWLDRRSQRAWRLRAPRVAMEVLLQGGRRQLLHPVAPVGAVLLGLWDGLRTTRTSLPVSERYGPRPGALPNPLPTPL